MYSQHVFASMKPITYPFRPRSTASLVPGQFWTIPLRDGRFASGRVLQIGGARIPTPSRSFFGGLMTWIGDAPPTAETLAGATLARVGAMHLRSITNAGGGEILGIRPLEVDGIEIPELLSATGGEGAMLLRGAEPIRRAQSREWGERPVLSYWGYDHINQLAEQLAAETLM